MKKNIIAFGLLWFITICVGVSYADFDYIISDTYYDGTLTLNSQSLQVTGEGVHEIIANGTSYIEVTNTTAYKYKVGGIRKIKIYGTSTADISGGEFDYIGTFENSSLNISGGSAVDVVFKGNSTITMSGGCLSGVSLKENATIDFSGGEIRWINLRDNSTAIFKSGNIEVISSYQNSDTTQHITFICDVDSINYNDVTNILTGCWLDGNSFSISLVDHDGYDTAYSNIQFVPEPATLALLGLGGLLIRKRKYI